MGTADQLLRRNAWLEQRGFSDPGKISQETVDVFATCAQQYGAEHAIFDLLTQRYAFDLESLIARVTQPMTLLWANSASVAPLEWAYRFQSLAKRSSLRIVEKTGLLPPGRVRPERGIEGGRRGPSRRSTYREVRPIRVIRGAW